MKKNILITSLLLFAFNVKAQNKTKEEVTALMAEDTCKCIAKKNMSKSDKMEDKEMALGLCLFESFNAHKSKSKYHSKKTMNDIEEIGEDVGFVMATMCADDFLSIFSSEELVEIVADDEEDINEGLIIEVELTAIHNDAVSYIEAKDDFSKSHKFLITDEFEGYELLKKSNFGQSFAITFKEVEYFDLSEKQYIIKKVITKVEAL
jgi:hypothetical protein